jgi:hypothetical protein
MSDAFYGFELLLLKRFQTHPELWYEWREKILSKVTEDGSRLDYLEDLGVSLCVRRVSVHRNLANFCLHCLHSSCTVILCPAVSGEEVMRREQYLAVSHF